MYEFSNFASEQPDSNKASNKSRFFSFPHSALAVQIGPCRITLIYGYFKRIIFIFCPNLAEPNLKYQFYLILPNFIKLNIENLA